jgi:diaminohydroxyphosphoribosylaminopyrimidine deaminase/5-amino-6-(5-phosphoribosylamino)uracil reductase
VVRDGRVVGRGAHRRFGEAHAETVALAEAGEATRGATLYATLEPCTHVGKQPACVPAIVGAGIARVVVALRDPNPEARGGIEALRDAGITVELGVGEEAARRLNFRFLHRFSGATRPFVAVKLAVSMDGYLADQHGASQWISGPVAREWVHRERAGYGAIAVGGATAVRDDVRLTVRGGVVPRVPPTRIVFDRSGALEPAHGIFADAADVPVMVVAATPRPDLEPIAGVTVIVAPTLEEAMGRLAQSGIDAVLVEGGGRLAGALLHAGLVDRVYQVQAPLWLGAGRPAWAGLPATTPGDAVRWRTVARRRLGDDTLMVLER